jgi:hypothetical protein
LISRELIHITGAVLIGYWTGLPTIKALAILDQDIAATPRQVPAVAVGMAAERRREAGDVRSECGIALHNGIVIEGHMIAVSELKQETVAVDELAMTDCRISNPLPKDGTDATAAAKRNG